MSEIAIEARCEARFAAQVEQVKGTPMNAGTQAGSTLGSSAMTLEGWCVLAMGALFGLFLVCVWWELRAALRRVGRDEKILQRATIRFETEAAFGREIARGRASERVQSLRAMRMEQSAQLAQASSVHAANVSLAHGEHGEAAQDDLGMESVGRILQRLAQAAPEVEDEVPAFTRPALNMVRGGMASTVAAGTKANEEDEAVGSVEEVGGGTVKVAPPRRGRGQSAGQREGSRARNGVKSNAIGASSIGAGAMVASR
jgi:hypothetical protein